MKKFSISGKIASLTVISGLGFLPLVTLAQEKITNITGLVARLTGVINLIIPFLVGLAVLAIIYGVLTYIFNAANEEKRKEARVFIIYGIVGVFVMLSVRGLVNILSNSFATD